MTIEEILSLGSLDEIKYELTQRAAPKVTVEVCLKQLDPLSHDVFNQAIRPKKTVKKASGQKDDKGQPIYNDSQEEVARIAIPFQQIPDSLNNVCKVLQSHQFPHFPGMKVNP